MAAYGKPLCSEQDGGHFQRGGMRYESRPGKGIGDDGERDGRQRNGGGFVGSIGLFPSGAMPDQGPGQIIGEPLVQGLRALARAPGRGGGDGGGAGALRFEGRMEGRSKTSL